MWFFWLVVAVFFHYNFVSIYGDEDIKWNSIMLLLHVEYKIYNSIRIGFHMLPWRLLTNSLNNTSFGTKYNILDLRNMQLKLVLQNGLQQQRKNLFIYTDIEIIKKPCISKGKVKKNFWKKTLIKTFGFFATTRLIQDWKAAEPNEVLTRDCT